MAHSPWRVVIIVVLVMSIATPCRAETLQAAADQIIAGIVAVSAGIAVLVTYLILHNKHKSATITGCVVSAGNGMSVTDEKDKRVYRVSGDPVGMKAGNRMTFEGKRKKGNDALLFEAHSVRKDFGVCPP